MAAQPTTETSTVVLGGCLGLSGRFEEAQHFGQAATAVAGETGQPFDLVIEGQDAPGGWELPIPAAYVAGRDGIIAYAFGDADWSKRAEPADMVAAIERIA